MSNRIDRLAQTIEKRGYRIVFIRQHGDQEMANIMDSGVVQSRAELARFLGVSRARVTQVLKRLVTN